MPKHQHLFIIGAARSGTKFIRSLVETDTRVAVIPYDINFVWRKFLEHIPHDRFTESDFSPKTQAYLHRTLSKLSRNRSNDNDRIILEKTVSNSLRLSYINKNFPDAAYIILIRNGWDTAASTVTQWKAKPKLSYTLSKLKYASPEHTKYLLWYAKNNLYSFFTGKGTARLWGVRYQGIQEDIEKEPLDFVCAKQWRESIRHTLSDIPSLNPENYTVVSYDHLVESKEEILKACPTLGLNPHTVSQKYIDSVSPNPPYKNADIKSTFGSRSVQLIEQTMTNEFLEILNLRDK